MRIVPKDIPFRVLFLQRRVITVFVSLLAALLLWVCGIVMFAKESTDAQPAAETECLTGQPAAFSDGSEPEEIVVSGNNSYLVTLKVDGEEYSCCYEKGSGDTVLDLLYRNDVYLNTEDEINHDVSEPLQADMSVEVGRVTYKEVTERVSIPFETQKILMTYALSSSMKGTYSSRLKNIAGVPGIREVVSKVKLVNGEVTESTVVSSKVISQPQNAVTYVDASYLLNVGNGVPSNYQKVLNCQFTAYTYNSQGGSVTASGAKAQVGYVAVDRSVIPLHSYLYIVLDNGFTYGYCYAKDTGGAIKGNIVDVFLPSETDCRLFGRRSGKVYVIS